MTPKSDQETIKEAVLALAAGLLAANARAQAQQQADSTEDARAKEYVSATASDRAVTFVHEMHDMLHQIGPKLGPMAKRPVATYPQQMDQVGRQFDGDHSDEYFTYRISQLDLKVWSCKEEVNAEATDAGSGEPVQKWTLHGRQLGGDSMTSALTGMIAEYVVLAMA